MKKFTDFICKHTNLILILTIILLFLSFVGIKLTKINYDILVYLPKDIETIKNILLELKKSHTIIVIDREQNIDEISDHIVVIDEHTVIEEGNREQLLKKKTFYSNFISKK